MIEFRVSYEPSTEEGKPGMYGLRFSHPENRNIYATFFIRDDGGYFVLRQSCYDLNGWDEINYYTQVYNSVINGIEFIQREHKKDLPINVCVENFKAHYRDWRSGEN